MEKFDKIHSAIINNIVNILQYNDVLSLSRDLECFSTLAKYKEYIKINIVGKDYTSTILVDNKFIIIKIDNLTRIYNI